MKRALIISKENKILIKEEEGKRDFPCSQELQYAPDADIFEFDDYIALRKEDLLKDIFNTKEIDLREALAEFPKDTYNVITKAAQLLNWSDATVFCSKDGNLLKRNSEISKICNKCGKEYFPSLSPAIVVLVKKGEEALLVHSKNFRRPFRALVAGFVETGETPEECVRREVQEETDLEIDNIKYIGSQSWPFPGQLMMGFIADYKSGEIKMKDGELDSANFFDRENLPLLPSMPSLSRQIIDKWIKKEI